MTATEIFNQIKVHGQSSADATTKTILPEILFPGKYVAQGDINIWPLESLPESVQPAQPERQLAPGTTRGSRHCICEKSMHYVEFYKLPHPNPLQGPILVFNDYVTIEHPEHGNQIWPPSVVAITYQRRYADKIRRIQD